jgi:hypothetical protein
MGAKSMALSIRALVAIAVVSTAFHVRRVRADAPIPRGEDAYTQLKFNTDCEAFLLKQLGDYAATTADPQPAREAAGKFLREYVRMLAGHPAPRQAERFKLVQPLLQQGVRDGRVLLAMGAAARAAGQTLAGKQLLEQVPGKPVGNDCPSIVKFLAYAELLDLAEESQQAEAVLAETASAMAEGLGAWMVEAKPFNGDLRFTWSLVRPFHLADPKARRLQPFFDRIAEDTRIEAWFRHTLAGAYLTDLAWERRGSAWASKTSPQQMREFQDTLEQAGPRLKQAYQLIPSHPEPAAIMIALAMAGADDESPRAWFDRAVAGQMDYRPAYARLLNALQPRWGGSFQSMLDFSAECLATARFDTNVPCALGIMIDMLGDDRDRLFREPQVYEGARAMCEGLYARRKWDLLDSWRGDERATRAWHAAAAILADKYPDARAQFDLLGDDPPKAPFVLFGYSPRVVHGRTYALTGPAGGKVPTLRKVLNDHSLVPKERLEKSRKLVEEVAALDPHAATQTYCRSLLELVRLETAFHAGEEVTLKITPELDGLSVFSGKWQADPTGALVGINDGSEESLEIHTTTEFRAPYELRCTMEYSPHSLPFFYPTVTAGFYPYAGNEDLRGARFTVASQSSTFAMDRMRETRDFENFSTPYPHRARHRFHGQFWPGYLRAIVDGDVVLEKAAFDFSPFGTIGFGTTGHGSRGMMRISDVRVRKLKQDLPPPETAEDRITYFDELVKQLPNDAQAVLDRGLARFDAKRVDDSIADFRAAARLEPDNPRAHLALAKATFFAGRHAEAKSIAEEYLKRNPLSPDAHFYLCDLLTISDQPGVADVNQAVAHAEQADKMTINARWWENLAWVAALVKQGNMDAAKKKAVLAMVRSPPDIKPRTQAIYESLMKGGTYAPQEHQGTPLTFLAGQEADKEAGGVKPTPKTD